jgi:hypothetical protein
MLDLSAAFDTIDHQILFNRLEYSTGVTNDALLWFKSYLMDRTQRVAIGSVQSYDIKRRFGVPQSSVLGPKLYFSLRFYDLINLRIICVRMV